MSSLKGGILNFDDVGGAIAFQKVQNKKGETVDTLSYSDKDEIALDYKAIQDMLGTNFYNNYSRLKVFNKSLKMISLYHNKYIHDPNVKDPIASKAIGLSTFFKL